MSIEDDEADVARLDWRGKEDLLHALVVGEAALGDGLSPCLAVGAHVDFVVLDARFGDGGGLQRDALEIVAIAEGELQLVGVAREGNALHGVPVGRGVAIEDVASLTCAGELRADVAYCHEGTCGVLAHDALDEGLELCHGGEAYAVFQRGGGYHLDVARGEGLGEGGDDISVGAINAQRGHGLALPLVGAHGDVEVNALGA